MASCKDCIHEQCCKIWEPNEKYLEKANENDCVAFKNKADFVEVPYRCETCIRKKGNVNECGDVYCDLHKGYFDKDAFCSYGEKE